MLNKTKTNFYLKQSSSQKQHRIVVSREEVLGSCLIHTEFQFCKVKKKKPLDKEKERKIYDMTCEFLKRKPLHRWLLIPDVENHWFNGWAEEKRGFPSGSVVKNPLARQETWVRSLGQEDPLEKEMAIHSSILAWKIPWTEEPGRL